MATHYVNSGTCGIWTASTAFSLGQRVVVDTGASSQYWARVYECTTAGTTGGSRPTWNSTVAATVTDNTVVWTCRAASTWANANRFVYYLVFAQVGQGQVVAGDDVWVKNTHSETQASVSFGPSGAYFSTAPVRIFSTASAAEPPTTVTAGATWKSTATFAVDGNFEFYGMTLVACEAGASGNFTTNSNQNHTLVMKDCALKLLSTSSTARFTLGFGSTSNPVARARYEGCTFTFGHASQRITLGRELQEFVECSLDGAGVLPTIMFEAPGTGAASPCPSVLQGCDFSGLGANTLMDISTSYGGVVFRNCKVHSGALTSGTPPIPTAMIFDNCDSADTNYKMARYGYSGSTLTETTRVKTGGASDGTTTISWKMTTNATITSRMTMPLRSPAITTWNETTGSARTLSVDILHDSVTALTNGDCWLEVEYLGTSGTSKASVSLAGRLTPPATTTTNHAASSATWTTTGLTNPNKQTLSATITPQEKGPILVWVCVAKASYTVYVDPLLMVA